MLAAEIVNGLKMLRGQTEMAATEGKAWTEEPSGADVGYMLRTSSESGKSTGQSIQDHFSEDDFSGASAFQYPTAGYVEARFGGAYSGIHGLLDGVGDWTRLSRHKAATWQIIAVLKSECSKAANGGSHRAPRGWVIYSGDAVGAVSIMIPLMARKGVLSDLANVLCDDAIDAHKTSAVRAPGSIVCEGDRNAVAAGAGGLAFTFGSNRHAVAFDGGAMSLGNFGCAVTLRGGLADARGLCADAIARRSVNSESAQSTAYASAGLFGTAVALGPNSAARAQIGGAMVLTEWSTDSSGSPVLVHIWAGKMGESNIWPGRWYTLKDGKPCRIDGPDLGGMSLDVHGYVPGKSEREPAAKPALPLDERVRATAARLDAHIASIVAKIEGMR